MTVVSSTRTDEQWHKKKRKKDKCIGNSTKLVHTERSIHFPLIQLKRTKQADINLFSSPHFFTGKPEKKIVQQRFKLGKEQVCVTVVYL